MGRRGTCGCLLPVTAPPLSRRGLFAAGLLVPLSGCTRSPDPAPLPPPDPDVALRTGAVAREKALLASYDLALAATPERSAVLGPLRADHATHLAALGSLEGVGAGPPVPPASGALPAAEQAASAGHAADALLASRPLASVLAALAACEASHAVVLG